MNHILYKIFALGAAASLYYSNDKGHSLYRFMMPGSAQRSGPGSAFHHK